MSRMRKMALCGLSGGSSAFRCSSPFLISEMRRESSARERMTSSVKATDLDLLLVQVIEHRALRGVVGLGLGFGAIFALEGAVIHLHLQHDAIIPGDRRHAQGDDPIVLRAALAADLIAVAV